jgi:hypothetical protein|tara:strand:+ start:193 stop:366 length:174 start_codon:yes stop_codon:yes gene_type:complete
MFYLNNYSGKIVIFTWDNIREILNFEIHRGAVLNPDKTAENKPILPDPDNSSVGSQI